MRFKKDDIVFDSGYQVVARIMDEIGGEALLLDEVDNPDAEIVVDFSKCQLATQEQIDACFNEPTTQWQRLCNTPSEHL